MGRIIVGFFFVIVGLGIFADQLGLNYWGINMFNLWPVLLIAFGFLMLARRRFMGAMYLFVFGFAFLLSTIFNFSVFAVVWPLIIILIGVSILFKPSWGSRHHRDSKETDHSDWMDSTTVTKDFINESVVFWGLDEIVKSENFEGGKIECVFGGFKLDLRDAKFSKEGANLEVTSVFGGGEIYLPRNVRVEVESTSVMGGVTNKAVSGSKEDPVIRIKASAVFGGIEIKN